MLFRSGRILSSPLNRAKETAEPFAHIVGKSIEILSWLKEMDDVVVWDERRPDLAVWNLSSRRLHGVEDVAGIRDNLFVDTKLQTRWEQLCAGTNQLLEEYGIAKQEKGWVQRVSGRQEDEVVIFCHLGIGLTLLAYLLDISPISLWRSAYLSPTSVTTLLIENQGKDDINFRVLRLGDVSHLIKSDIPIGTTGLQYNIK